MPWEYLTILLFNSCKEEDAMLAVDFFQIMRLSYYEPYFLISSVLLFTSKRIIFYWSWSSEWILILNEAISFTARYEEFRNYFYKLDNQNIVL